ncbi:MAG: hypothetical protein H6618_06170 [Deltaproteobacteria bacterium]|nr:hypothetical protein [Deltaproteobacteria bacterium]
MGQGGILSRLDRVESSLEHLKKGLSDVPDRIFDQIRSTGLILPANLHLSGKDGENGKRLTADKKELRFREESTTGYLHFHELTGRINVDGNGHVLYEYNFMVQEQCPIRITLSVQHCVLFTESPVTQIYSLFLDYGDEKKKEDCLAGQKKFSCFRNPEHPEDPVFVSRTVEFIIPQQSYGIHGICIRLEEKGIRSDYVEAMSVGVTYI